MITTEWNQSSITAPADISLRVCNRCIMDTTVPGIRFDANGICNYCALHDKLEKAYPLDHTAQARLERIINRIKTEGRNKRFDCVLGISGGRDSTYTLYKAVKEWGLRPLAVHFNDGFGNPVAGENMLKATKKLGVELRTVTSDWRESKDLKIAFLKASTPDLEEGTDVGIATALYGVAAKENIQNIIIGLSFRTEGILPLSWNYMDGKYLKSVHERFGTLKLRPWKPTDPGFHLDIHHLFYYAVIKGIKVVSIFDHVKYVRDDANRILEKELDWVYPGAHYFDDLYHSLMHYVYRVKFNIDRRKSNYSALIRSNQMPREEAIERVSKIYTLEDPKIIDLCIKRLGLSKKDFEDMLALPIKSFRDYPSRYTLMLKLKPFIKILSWLQIIPGPTYDKYFHCGA